MADSAPALKKLLKEDGCRFDRQGKGDHEIWYSPHTNRKFPVDRKIKSRNTANGVLKQAGLQKAFLGVSEQPQMEPYRYDRGSACPEGLSQRLAGVRYARSTLPVG